nr:hypothetical protein [Tanacetum cinerariifolium]
MAPSARTTASTAAAQRRSLPTALAAMLRGAAST